MNEIRILLVEDDDDHAALFGRAASTAHGCRVLSRVGSLAQAKAALREGVFDAVLLDLWLPDSRGVDTLRQVLAVTTAVPVVVLTSLDDAEVATSAIGCGAEDWLVKSDLSPRLLERALRYATERHGLLRALQQRNRELEAFASAAAHDLQAPLQQIGGFADLVVKDCYDRLDNEHRFWLEAIAAGAHRMATTVKDLLSYARTGGTEIRPVQVELRTLVDDALADLDSAVQDSAASVTHGPLPAVRGDATQLRLLLTNLIGNALKFHGQAPPRIHVGARRDGAWVTLEVADNGIGIPADQRETVFEPFRRLHPVERYPGTGLGLALCQRIVQAHGGRIWVESEAGRGSTFFCTLPAAER